MRYTLVILCFLLGACAHIEKPVIARPGNFFYYSDTDYLNYEVQGTGPETLVMLHGFGSSLRNWDDIRATFDRKQYTVYLVDLKGFGFSSVPSNTSYSFEANAELISSFIRDRQLSNFWLIGHSYGGGVALYVHAQLRSFRSTLPKGMILIDSAAYLTELPFFIEYLRYPVVSRTAFNATTSEFKARYTLERVYNSEETATDALIGRYAMFITDEKFPVFAGTARDIVPEKIGELTKYYGSIMCPVLVIWGENDTILPLSSGLRLAGELPYACLEIMRNCGHIPQEEHPEETARLIHDFLEIHR
jgi:pimeloyl-ACP methyl ester carboxylesterase